VGRVIDIRSAWEDAAIRKCLIQKNGVSEFDSLKEKIDLLAEIPCISARSGDINLDKSPLRSGEALTISVRLFAPPCQHVWHLLPVDFNEGIFA
jgi:hypothetical protein